MNGSGVGMQTGLLHRSKLCFAQRSRSSFGFFHACCGIPHHANTILSTVLDKESYFVKEVMLYDG